MDKKKLTEYYRIMEQLTDMTCRVETFSRQRFVELLNEFCDLFNIAKGVTEFYQNVRYESLGIGEVLIDRDKGNGDVEIINRRLIPESGVVIIGKLYMSSDDPPLSMEELKKVDLVHRLILSFVCRNRLQKQVYRFAFADEDNYPNRRAFMRYIDEKIEKGEQYGHIALCINLHHFSLVNQDLGREIGDRVLKNYFEYLESIIADKGIIARLGGDNFIIYAEEELKNELLRVFAGVPVYYEKNNKDKYVMIAARAGIYMVDGEERLVLPGQILDKVYPAIQIAKHRGENIVYYDREINENRERILKVRRAFYKGLKSEEVRAYYQPKVDIETGKVVGAEALCRWFHDGRLVMPVEFIPILEMNNDICRLDFYMLEVVCKDIRRWLDEGRCVPRVSVNLSRKHLTDESLLHKLLYIIDKYNVPHEYIEIELTETTTDVEFRDLNRVVCGLKDAGVQTSVDDFGNGYSSLNLIRTIPWNVVKIDRTLLPMDDDSMDSNTAKMFAHVVAMARDIGIVCLSEGVETERQVKILSENKCHYAQGFFFEKAIPVEDFEKLLEGAPFEGKLKELGVIG